MLIDTPGFDDTTKSDTDILKLITEYLCAASVTFTMQSDRNVNFLCSDTVLA